VRGWLSLFVIIATASLAAAPPRLATVSGSVADDCTIPVDNARVLLVRADRAAAGSAVVVAATTETNYQGEFRLDNVSPGRYLVLVRPDGFQQDVYLASGYAPTWYPAAMSLAGATPIDVATGQDVPGIVVTLTMGPMYSVSGRVAGSTAERRELILTARDTVDVEVFRGALRPDGRFFIGGVPPGDYILRAVAPSGTNRAAEGAAPPALTAPVRVYSSDVTGIVLSR